MSKFQPHPVLTGAMTRMQLHDMVEHIVDSMLVGVPTSIPALQDIPGSQTIETVFARRITYPTLLPPQISYKDSNRGILLFGPSGCGKTFIAQSFAKTSGWTYIKADLGQLLHRWEGVSELIVVQMFERASKEQPTIIFIDEIDALIYNADFIRHIKHELGRQMKRLRTKEQRVILIGVTSTPWDVDASFLPHFSERIHIGMPDESVCARLITRALAHRRHTVSATHIAALAAKPYMRRFSCDDIGKVIERLLLRLCADIIESHYYKDSTHDGNPVIIPCKSDDEHAQRRIYGSFTQEELKLVSYQPIELTMLEVQFQVANPTALQESIDRHADWASRYATVLRQDT